jgi:hypothetical protein
MPVKQSDSLQRTFADPLNPTFVGGSFKTAAARLGAGQARNPDTPVYQQDTGEFHYLRPLAECFEADGVTPATNRGTWGTLNAHWRQDQSWGGFGLADFDPDTLSITVVMPSGAAQDLSRYGILLVEATDNQVFNSAFAAPFQ